MTARSTALALAALLLLGACTAPAPSGDAEGLTPAPATSAPASAAPAAPLPDIPVRSADLSALTVPDAPAPTAVRIPSLEIDVPVDPVGVQADGQMEIPPLAERAGWYRYGAAPGEPEGTAVIAAHVDSVASAGLGPFARLRDLAPGATVEVSLADGAVVPYVVTSVTSVAKDDAAWDTVFTREGPARLVLVTCGGTFQREASRYSDNIIVTADPVR
ncbi:MULTISPECIES: class F sortase [unclassified Actinotalea]|uniref:class F sortase n=1 Tax=unclassified Actinotalea TaxID=2638618 RepID=UPI0015F3FBE6|nr:MULTISPECIES: class F sortase [unclassified Actinotalea]